VSAALVRIPEARDRLAIHGIVERAFGGPAEAMLVDRLVADGDKVFELIAERDGRVVGHILFSRLLVENTGIAFDAVALAPLAVDPDFQRQGIGSTLVVEAHERLKAVGERLSIVVGEPDYYGRFGYRHDRAANFESEYQCEALQALSWGGAPALGRLIYAAAFGAL
jgi:putative acetyltransferase